MVEVEVKELADHLFDYMQLKAQRNRLREALRTCDSDFLLFAGGTPRADYRIEQDESYHLQPGDMTSD